MNTFCAEIRSHYSKTWVSTPIIKRWAKGPVVELPPDFCVLEFAPRNSRQMWTYATCCMSTLLDEAPLELHLFSPSQADSHVERLTVIAHFHRTRTQLGIGDTVNFGRPWLANSICDYGLISLPYLDGTGIEECHSQVGGKLVRCLWLIPITKSERDYKAVHGLEALEFQLEQTKFDYLNPLRASVVAAIF